MHAETEVETDKRKQLRRWFRRQSALWQMVAVVSALLTAIIVAAIYLSFPPAQLVPLLRMMATVCFFLPALIFAEAEFHALPEHVKRYEQMFSIFERAKKMLEEIAGAPPSGAPPSSEKLDWNSEEVRDRAQRIYRELGREALLENGEWLAIHRERPLDIEA